MAVTSRTTDMKVLRHFPARKTPNNFSLLFRSHSLQTPGCRFWQFCARSDHNNKIINQCGKLENRTAVHTATKANKSLFHMLLQAAVLKSSVVGIRKALVTAPLLRAIETQRMGNFSSSSANNMSSNGDVADYIKKENEDHQVSVIDASITNLLLSIRGLSLILVIVKIFLFPQVVIWSKSYCPHCRMTKNLFEGRTDVDVATHELDMVQNGNAIQNELAKMTGQRTVPNVFVNNKHLGGNDDTQLAFRDGKLEAMLKERS